MTLEEIIKANTAALEANTAALKAASGSQGNAGANGKKVETTSKADSKAEAEEAVAEAEVDRSPKISQEQFEDKIRELAKATSKAKAKKVMEAYGASAMAEVKESDRDACYNDAVEALEAAEDDDDI